MEGPQRRNRLGGVGSSATLHICHFSFAEMSSWEQRQTFMLPGFKPMRNILLSSPVQRGLTRMPGARSIIPSSRFHCSSLTKEKNLGPWGSRGPAFSQTSHFARFRPSTTSTFICFSPVGVTLTLPSHCFPELSELFFLPLIQHHICNFAQLQFAAVQPVAMTDGSTYY